MRQVREVLRLKFKELETLCNQLMLYRHVAGVAGQGLIQALCPAAGCAGRRDGA
jgi:hypothetical protein